MRERAAEDATPQMRRMGAEAPAGISGCTSLVDIPFPSLTDVGQRQPELALELDRLTACQAEQRDLDVVAAREGLQLRHPARWQARDKAGGGFPQKARGHA